MNNKHDKDNDIVNDKHTQTNTQINNIRETRLLGETETDGGRAKKPSREDRGGLGGTACLTLLV